MKINEQIAFLRKQKGLTQEELAQAFGVTNQAVSKWESGASCPDIALLPDIADYFGVSIDLLFGKAEAERPTANRVNDVPWADDDTVRIIVYRGKTILNDSNALSKLSFALTGDLNNVECHCDLHCGDIKGNANAGCDILCEGGSIGGQAIAGCDIQCSDIWGSANAGCDVHCGDIQGNANAGCDIHCTNIQGTAQAGCDIVYKK